MDGFVGEGQECKSPATPLDFGERPSTAIIGGEAGSTNIAEDMAAQKSSGNSRVIMASRS